MGKRENSEPQDELIRRSWVDIVEDEEESMDGSGSDKEADKIESSNKEVDEIIKSSSDTKEGNKDSIVEEGSSPETMPKRSKHS